MPNKVNYMVHGEYKVRETCKKCYYLDSSLGTERIFRCHGNGCPDLVMTSVMKKYFLDNWVNNHVEYEKTHEEMLDETIDAMAYEIARSIDQEILDRLRTASNTSKNH